MKRQARWHLDKNGKGRTIWREIKVAVLARLKRRNNSSDYAIGILDFYHAAGNLWRGAKAWLDGRTNKARQWFASARLIH